MSTTMLAGKKIRGFQLGLESTGGTTVAANKLIPNGVFSNKRMDNVTQAMSEGHRSSVGVQRGKRWSEFSLGGQLGYNVLPYLAHGLYDIVAPSTVATGAFSYTYAETSTNGVQTLHVPQTYTFEYGNSRGSNSKFGFGTFADLSLSFTESGVTYSASGFGAYPTKNITMTATPTRIAPNLVNYTDCKISFATTYAGLSSGKLLTGKGLELSIKNKYKSTFFIDDATISIGGILEFTPDCTGKVTVAEGSESDLFLAALEASTPFWLQLNATGPLITAGTPNTYNLITDTWACLLDTEEEGDTADLFTGAYSFHMAEDAINNDMNLVVINPLASL